MQDRYAGDIGDFGKLGLLRVLCQNGGPRLGMAWWMNLGKEQSNDGKFIDYLEKRSPALRNCDPELFDALARLVRQGNRSVAALCELNVLPADTLHHLSVLQFPWGSHRDVRLSIRGEWLERAAQDLEGAELVFVDPDNGISGEPRFLGSPKHACSSDFKAFASAGRSFVVYHHFDRSGPAVEQLERATQSLQEAAGQKQRPWTFWYHRGTARGYLVSPSEPHRNLLRDRLDEFLEGPWGQNEHFVETFQPEASA